MRKVYIYLIVMGIFVSIIVSFGYNYYIIRAGAGADQVEDKEVVNIDSLLATGKKAYYIGEIEEAKEKYSRVLVKQPGDIRALKNLFFITQEGGELKEALKYNQQLVELEPENLLWRYEQGLILFQLGRYKESQEVLTGVYQEVLELKESDQKSIPLSEKREALLYYYLGQAAEKLKQTKEAEFFYQLGKYTLPHLTLNYTALARLYKRQDRIEDAITAYRNALGRDPSLSVIYPELALSYEDLGEDKAAYYYWNKSLTTGNRVKLAKERLASLKREHPEYIEEAREEKERAREKINWVKVTPVADSDKIPEVRVGLIDNTSSINFQAGGPFEVIEKNVGKKILTGGGKEEWMIKRTGEGYSFYQDEQLVKTILSDNPLILRLTDNTRTFVLYDISFGQGYFWAGNEDRQYRGELELYPVGSSRFNVINIINLEEYLFSVVPAEMPAWWPEEALKAQTIAARSYALAHLGRHSREGYDLCSTVHCAVYKGVVSENNLTNQAVLATLGEVGYYQDRVIDAVFSSNSGGYSESSADVWGNSFPYLSGANNMLGQDFNFPLEPYQLKEWLIDEPASYSYNPRYAGYNKYRWIKVLSSEYFINKYNLKELKNIIPVGRSKGGSVERVIIQGKEKEVIIERDRVRSGLGGLRSNRFVLDKLYNLSGTISQVIFYGSGWGHNVGMDQTGAAGMAEEGFTYREIIKHFYKGATIKKAY